LTFIYFSPALCFIFVYNCGLTVRNKRICYVRLCYRAAVGQKFNTDWCGENAKLTSEIIVFVRVLYASLLLPNFQADRVRASSPWFDDERRIYCEASAAAVRESCSLRRSSPGRQGPDFQNILRQSYDYLSIMPKLRSTYDGRLIYKTSYEGRNAFLRYDSLAKL